MGLGLHERWKRLSHQFIRWIEVDCNDHIWRRVMNRKLKKRLMKGRPGISRDDRAAAMDFWRPFTTKFNFEWIQFYSHCYGAFDPRYIPDDLYYTTIDRHLNNQRLGRGLADKNYLSRLYPEIRQPVTVLRKINGHYCDADYCPLTEAEAIKSCNNYRELVIKPTVETHGGDNVTFWQRESPLVEHLRSGGNLIVQKPVGQHKMMMQLHASSVNTIRMTTLLKDGKAYLLSALVRMGVGGKRVDNAWAGGISCGIRQDGRLKPIAFTIEGERVDRHPDGAVFSDCLIPNYDRFVALAEKLQEQTPHNRMVSWDFAVGEDGEPTLIEANLWSGGSMVHQYCNGPLFGELTEAVLEEVFGKRSSDS